MTTDKYLFFWNGPFSQWYPSIFFIDDTLYENCEKYMMAMKALLFEDHEIHAKIMAADDPKHIKSLGRKVRNFDSNKWEAICQQIVFDGNYAKFTQNPKLKEMLLKTGDKLLVEASPYDKIWGIGLEESDPRCLDKSKWEGKNLLGIAITLVRETIKMEIDGISYIEQKLTNDR